MLRKTVKKIIGIILHLFFLDFLIFLFSKILFFLSRLLFLKEWKYSLSGVPLFFKHQINLNRWRFDSTEWAFTLRGVYAREKMFLNCKVLDLCCGDGAYSFLFFSDIASHIDAVDYDKSAITYAKRYYKHSKVNYQRVNIISEPLLSNDYDIVVWNAGICYFTMEQIHSILNKLIQSGKQNMILCGMLPKANNHVDHKTEFEDINSIKAVFELFFEEIDIKEVLEGSNLSVATFYFNVSKPK